MKRDWKRLCKNKNFWYFTFNFSIIHGIYCALGATVNNLARPFYYTAKESSIFGVSCILSGLVASVVYAKYLDCAKDKWRTMINLLHTIGIGSLLTYTAFLFNMKPGNVAVVSINMALVGIFNVAIIPIGFYAAAEMTKPVSEVMSTGIIMTFGMIVGVAITFLVSALCEGNDPRGV